VSNAEGSVGCAGCKGLPPSKVGNGYGALITESGGRSVPRRPCRRQINPADPKSLPKWVILEDRF